MIRVNSQGSRALGTGKNVNGTASTFISEGPKDDLAAIDAYQGSLPSDAPFDPAASAGASGAASSSANGTRTADGIADRLNASGGTSERVTAALWEAILCGSVPPDAESSGSRRARMGRTAMWMRSTGCGAEDLVGLLAVRGGQAGVNREELQRRMDAALDNSLAVLDDQERENLINALSESTGVDAGQIRTSVAGSESTETISATRQEEVRGLAGLLNQYAGDSELVQVFDVAAESAILDSLLSKSLDLGLPQAWTEIMSMIDDDEIRTKRALRSLRQAAILSNLKTVNEVVDLTSPEQALAEVPDLIPTINRFYNWGRNTPSSQYPEKRDELIATLNKINPSWAKKKRNGVWVDDLEPFNNASPQALTLFKQSPYAVQAMIAEPYTSLDYRTLVRKYHPFAIDFSRSA